MQFTLAEVLGALEKAAPFIPATSLSTRWRFGEHSSRFLSDGHDFYQIREYDPEKDALAQILWDSRQPDGRVYVREARAAKEFTVIILADLSASICFSAGYPYKLRMLLETIGNLGLTCFHGQDPLGFIGFTDQIIFSEPPRVSQSQVYYCLERLYDFFQTAARDETLKKNLGAGTDFSQALDFFSRQYGHRRCFLIVISDFIGFSLEENRSFLKDLLAQHEAVFLFLDDPAEFTQAGRWGYIRMENIETGEQFSIAAKKFRRQGQKVRQERKRLRETLRDFNIDSMVLEYGKHHRRLWRFLTTRRESGRL